MQNLQNWWREFAKSIANIQVTRVDAAMQTDFNSQHHPQMSETKEDTEDLTRGIKECPTGWAKLTNGYVRLADGIPFTEDEMNELTTEVACKQEPYLSLPGMVQFYKDRAEYCTKEQAKELIQHLYINHLSNDKALYCTPCRQFYSKGTRDISIQLHFTPLNSEGQFKVILDTKDPLSTNTVESYVLAEGTRETLLISDENLFPSIYDCFQYIPYLYYESEMNLKTDTSFPRLQVTESELCVNSRSAIIDLEDEVSELEKRLESLRKRKHEIESASRNVRPNVSPNGRV